MAVKVSLESFYLDSLVRFALKGRDNLMGFDVNIYFD
jgi:hypothetical protein